MGANQPLLHKSSTAYARARAHTRSRLGIITMTRMSTNYDRIEFNEKLIYVHTEACESRDWLKTCRLKMIINYVERGYIVKNDLYSGRRTEIRRC